MLANRGLEEEFLKTGIEGLDFILGKGIPRKSIISVEGAPGTGKTNFAMQFLVNGIQNSNESGAYITFEELPEQIYKDMLSFNWDLKELEKQNKFRLICVSPEVLLDGLLTHDGFIETLLKEIDCQRLVIDSISLFRFSFAEDMKRYRSTLYSLRNIFRKLGITTIFIKELSAVTNDVDFENYVVDGVIRLSLKEHLEIFRKRTLEILKMRGTKISEGEHIFDFEPTGINVVPALSTVEDKIIKEKEFIKTGVTELDQFLGGGIPKGSIKMIDTNSKANYRYLLMSIFVGNLKMGKKGIFILSPTTSLKELISLYSLFNCDLIEEIKKDNILIIECVERPLPKEIEAKIVKTDALNATTFIPFIVHKIKEFYQHGDEILLFFDIQSLISQFGKAIVQSFISEHLPVMHESGITTIILNNYRQSPEADYAALERMCNGVLKTWNDGSYQYLQITKSSHGRMSKPYIVQNIECIPYIRLV